MFSCGFQRSTSSDFIHERMVGNQRSRSKTFTARRCSVVSSGASITVGRRPALPVAVRTKVARIWPRFFMVWRAEASVLSAILARLGSGDQRNRKP